MEKDGELMDSIRAAVIVMDALKQVADHLSVHATYNLVKSMEPLIDLPFVRTTYPAEWVTRYLIADYVKVDPIALAGFERDQPFDWSQIEAGTMGLRMMSEAMEHGIGPSGFSIPLADRHGRRALFSVSSSLTGRPWEEFIAQRRKILIELAGEIHRIAMVEIYGRNRPPKLTRREREVLMWTARGKDYKTIAMIIGISPHTIKAYLKSARYKLDCSTLAQAVAKALSLRIINS